MDSSVDALLHDSGGAASRAQLLRVVSRATLDDQVRRRLLSAVFPRAYARAWNVDDPSVRLRAALVGTGGEVALSHVTALEQWRLLPVQNGPIHVTAYNPRHPRGVPGELVVHRTRLPLDAVNLNGLNTVRAESAALTSWSLLGEQERRAPIIDGSRRKLFDARRLVDRADAMWWLRDLAALRSPSSWTGGSTTRRPSSGSATFDAIARWQSSAGRRFGIHTTSCASTSTGVDATHWPSELPGAASFRESWPRSRATRRA